MTSEDFRVSVIITSYNHRELLGKAIESVLAQTLPAYEVLVADDASRDGSVALIQDYEARYPEKVRALLQERNVGIPRNRNAALEQVRGNFVCILDGDDSFVPRKLERQFEAFRRRPDARVVYSNFLFVSPGRAPRPRFQGPQPEGDILPAVAYKMVGLLRTLVADVSAFRQAGLLDPALTHLDGYWLSLKLAEFCRFAYVDEPLVHKRARADSLSSVTAESEFLAELELIYQRMEANWRGRLTEWRSIQRFWDKELCRKRILVSCQEGRWLQALRQVLESLLVRRLTPPEALLHLLYAVRQGRRFRALREMR